MLSIPMCNARAETMRPVTLKTRFAAGLMAITSLCSPAQADDAEVLQLTTQCLKAMVNMDEVEPLRTALTASSFEEMTEETLDIAANQLWVKLQVGTLATVYSALKRSDKLERIFELRNLDRPNVRTALLDSLQTKEPGEPTALSGLMQAPILPHLATDGRLIHFERTSMVTSTCRLAVPSDPRLLSFLGLPEALAPQGDAPLTVEIKSGGTRPYEEFVITATALSPEMAQVHQMQPLHVLIEIAM